MRILHLTTYLQGGAGRIILDLLLKQRAAGHQVAVVMNKTSESGYLSYPEYMQVLEKEQIPFIEVDSTFKRDLSQNFNAISEIQQLLDQSPFDVIHAHAAIPAMIGIIARSSRWPYIPVIQTMHGWGLNKSLLQEKMDVSIMNSLDKVVAVSLSDQHLLEKKGVKRKHLTTIYNGVEEIVEENFKNPVFEEIQDFKKNGYRIIGCIGGVCERKNQFLLIEALKYLQNKERIKCIFIGEGEGELIPHLQDKTKTYGLEHLVKFYGYQKNGKQFLKLFDWLVMPSKSEGLALVILEAFQMRVPVLASNIAVFKEMLEEGVTGYLFESDNVLALSDKLEKLLSLPSESLQPLLERAYSKFQSLFTTDAMVKNYESLYTQMVSKVGL